MTGMGGRGVSPPLMSIAGVARIPAGSPWPGRCSAWPVYPDESDAQKGPNEHPLGTTDTGFPMTSVQPLTLTLRCQGVSCF
jgi:hypothetical protein